MTFYLARPVGYSRAEYLSDVVVHVLGILAVVMLVPLLIGVSFVIGPNTGPISAAVTYSAVFAAMIFASAAYNVFPHPEWEWLLKRLDHAAIYLKIAGTFTAFALIADTGFALVTAVWLVATVGIALKLLSPYRFRLIGIALYVGLGAYTGLAADAVFVTLPSAVIYLLSISGTLYIVGLMFYLYDKLPYHYAVWHVFVLIATLLVYAAVFVAMVWT